MSAPAAASTARSARVLAPTRPAPSRRPPRRVSGPVRAPLRPERERTTAPRARPRPEREGLLLGLLGAVETVSTHRLLDRLIRGRAWIALVAFALIGIVTLQLGLLKLNSGIGRALERESRLQRENAALSIENSELASGARVEAQAGKLGMRIGSVDGLHFLASSAPGSAARAALALKVPLKAATATGQSASESGGGETGKSESGGGESSKGESSSGGESSSHGETAGGGESSTGTSAGTSAGASAGTAGSGGSGAAGSEAAAARSGSGEAASSGTATQSPPAEAEAGGTTGPGG